MATATDIGSQPRLGDIFSVSFKVLNRNAAAFAVLALTFSLPWEVYWDYATYFAESDLVDSNPLAQAAEAVTVIAAQSILTGLAAGAIAYGTFLDLNGQPAGFGICIRRGLALVAPVIGVVLLSSLLALIGYIAAVIPGFIVSTVLWLVVPVTVVERPGIINSLRRSSVLTKGYRWQIFGMILILGAAAAGALWLIETVAAPSEATAGGLLPYFFISIGVTSVLTAFEAVVTTVTYCLLRAAKEGTAIAEIAKVFD